MKFGNGTVQGQRGSLALQAKGIARRRTPVLAGDDNLKLLAMMSRALYLTVAVPAMDGDTRALTYIDTLLHPVKGASPSSPLSTSLCGSGEGYKSCRVTLHPAQCVHL